MNTTLYYHHSSTKEGNSTPALLRYPNLKHYNNYNYFVNLRSYTIQDTAITKAIKSMALTSVQLNLVLVINAAYNFFVGQ